MKIGTKSVLYGFHQCLLHPLFVAEAWRRTYGFPTDPRLWVCFLVHDLGYWGKPNMDGAEGERHPETGAAIARRLFGDQWGDLVLYHSRFYAASKGAPPSRLCIADKLAICLYPFWLWKLLVCATGEVDEYLVAQKYTETAGNYTRSTLRGKYDAMVAFLLLWVEENK